MKIDIVDELKMLNRFVDNRPHMTIGMAINEIELLRKNIDDCLSELSNLHSLAEQVLPSKEEIGRCSYVNGKERAVITISVRTKDIVTLRNKVDSLKWEDLAYRNRRREKELGFTLLGPHRDDLSFSIGEQVTRSFGSEGQKKTTLGALRLAEWERLAQHTHEAPIMAIDELIGRAHV